MKERPILFSTPMTKLILDGRKTQTRRVIKPKTRPWVKYFLEAGASVCDWKPWCGDGEDDCMWWWLSAYHAQEPLGKCPYGQPGDRLYVREGFAHCPKDFEDTNGIIYRADNKYNGHVASYEWRPSIHMPKAATRITLEITGVRVERVQDISEEDADAEGFNGDFPLNVFPDIFYRDMGHLSIPECFGIVWDSINENRPGCSWADNPWVWVLEFRRIS
jgi:hypothetical protein